MADETVFLNRGEITVTSARIMLKGTTYALRNVTSVTMRTIPPKVLGRNLFGILLLIVGLAMLAAGSYPAGVISAAIGGVIIYLASKAKSEYVVAMSTSAGQVDALKSTDKAEIQEIVGAINNAMVHKG